MEENKTMAEIEEQGGALIQIEVITYLKSDDGLKNYLVYSKGEKQGDKGDEIFYLSRVMRDNDKLILRNIEDDAEWSMVQNLLKKVANVKPGVVKKEEVNNG